MKPADHSRIGIFGGTFDPVHHGHLKIAESFLASNLLDELLVLPTPVPPHKKRISQTPFIHRFVMLRLAFRDFPDVTVSDLENQLETPSYTLRTIQYLQQTYERNRYFLCMGEDSLASFHKWWKYQQIIKQVPLIVAARPGAEGINQSTEILDRAILIDHEEMELSSTTIRQKASEGVAISSDYVPEAVAEYISKHELYGS